MESHKLVTLINKLQILVEKVTFVPELFGIPAANIQARGLMNEQTLILEVKNNLAQRRNRLFKRIFDITATVIGGILIFTCNSYRSHLNLLRLSRSYRIWS